VEAVCHGTTGQLGRGLRTWRRWKAAVSAEFLQGRATGPLRSTPLAVIGGARSSRHR
jgi:hypothetical protein